VNEQVFDFGSDDTRIEDLICQTYEAAFRASLRVVPRQWHRMWPIAPTGYKVSGVAVDESTGSGMLSVPADYLALGKLQMEGWKKAVYNATDDGTPEAVRQQNLWYRGNQFRPVVVDEVQEDPSGLKSHVLRYYGCTPGRKEHEVKTALYIKIPDDLSQMAEADEMDLDDQIILAMAYLNASEVCYLLQKGDLGQLLQMKAQQCSM